MTPPIQYGRAWRKGPTGLETSIGNPPEVINIAHGNEEIWQLIGFLQREWPQLFRKWLDVHPEIHPTLKQHLPPATITVQWAELVVKIKSRTRADKVHTVTRVQGRYSCDCEAFMYGKTCWAMATVIAREEAKNATAPSPTTNSPGSSGPPA